MARSLEGAKMLLKSDLLKLPLLHIESNPEDRDALQEAVRCCKAHFRVYPAEDLESAAPYFFFPSSREHPSPRPRPGLILLDYNVGLHTGADFLYWLRVQNRTTSIPVVMYTNSATPHQVAECYANGASHFLRKPTDCHHIRMIVRVLDLGMSSRIPHLEWLAKLPEYEAAVLQPQPLESPRFSAPLTFIQNKYLN